jgi:hypothetical protein
MAEIAADAAASTPQPRKPPITRWLWLAGALIAVESVLVANWFPPIVRFTIPALNDLTFLLALAIPCVLLGIGLRMPWRAVRVLSGVGLVLLAIGAVLALPVAGLGGVFDDYDSGWTPIQAVTMPAYRLVLYRTDCGATCDFGLVLRQEWHLAPGLLRLRAVADWYPAYAGEVRALGHDSVRVVVQPMPQRPQSGADRLLVLDPSPF